MKRPKHQRQVNRKLKNMSKSVRLDIKKYCNRTIKDVNKDKKLKTVEKVIILIPYRDTLAILKEI